MWNRKLVKQCWRVWKAKMNTEACGGTTMGSLCLLQLGVIKTQKLGRRTSQSWKAEFEGGGFLPGRRWPSDSCAEEPSWQPLVAQGLGEEPTALEVRPLSTSPSSLQDWMAGCKLQTRGQLLLEPGSVRVRCWRDLRGSAGRMAGTKASLSSLLWSVSCPLWTQPVSIGQWRNVIFSSICLKLWSRTLLGSWKILEDPQMVLFICVIFISIYHIKDDTDSVTPWTAARQASLTFTISWRLLRLMSIATVMPSNHFIINCTLLFLPSMFPSIRVFFPVSQFFASGG